MFRNNRNNENMGFNSDGRINEFPDEEEERQVKEDLLNEGVTPQQIEVLDLIKLKNQIKTDRRLGTMHGSKGQDVRVGYEDNDYYMGSYNIARRKWENASKSTTRSDTATGAAGGRPNTPPRRGPVPGRSPGKNDRLSQEEHDELREPGAADTKVDASLARAFADIARGY
jgi:hypothetical protein